MKVTVTSLCVQAGVGTRTFYEALNGEKEMRASTLAKLNMALGRFKRAYGGEKGPLTIHAAYKASLVLAAAHLKADARNVIFSDPSRKATANKEWMEAARVRRFAYWITSNMLGFGPSDVARAAGVTKQAVSTAIKEVEDDEDPEIRVLRLQIEEVFS